MKRKGMAVMFLLMATAIAAEANPVDMDVVREVGLKFVNANARRQLCSAGGLQWVSTYKTSRGDAAFYVFNTSNGFIIVSADDCATPILGYSNKGHFDIGSIPIQLQDYLQGFVQQIEYGIGNHLSADATTARQWELVRTTGRLNENRDSGVGPLVTALWDQDCYYNAQCPEDENGPCGHALVGCGATAMGMLMRYWGYPENGMGWHSYTPDGYPEQSVSFSGTTYDWANMPDQLTETSTQEEIDAVSTLLWHCGVAVNMQYGSGWSGSSVEGIFNALMSFFNYSEELSFEDRSSYTDASWKAKLKDCLDLGRPLGYAGRNPSGHFFVCDGYDADGLFHFNWGWSGFANGYYATEALYGGYSDYGNCALFNMHPKGITTNYVINAMINGAGGGSVSGGGTFAHGDIVTLSAVANVGYHFCYWGENGGIASTNPNYSFIANFNRNLVAVFCSQPLTFTLSEGVNWFSTNVEITLDDLKAALVAALPDTSMTIQSQTQNTRYISGRWTGGLNTLNVAHMYKIIVNADCEISLEGIPINPTEHPVTISTGANWIAFPFGESKTVSETFAGFAVNGDAVQSQTSNTNYRNSRWVGQLSTLEPGKGYIYQSSISGDRIFTFPSGTK